MTRFSETEKWRDPWFRALKPSAKLLFLFVIDNCNNAGFWEEDKDYACYSTGMSESDYLGAKEGLKRGLVGADGWLWVRKFLKHQKNEALNPENNAHQQIIRLLNEQVPRFQGIEEFTSFLAPHEGLLSPIGKGKGKGKGPKEEVQEENSDPVNGQDQFSEFWDAYPKKKAKGDAEKSWKTHKLGKLFDSIMAGLKRAKVSQDWKKDSGKWIPHPATWLNQKGWEDGVPVSSNPRPKVEPVRVEDIGPMEGFEWMRDGKRPVTPDPNDW